MTATSQPHSSSAWGLHAPDDDNPGPLEDLDEQLCRVQADMLAMGRDNYERLRRVCPDPQRRYRVLQSRVDRQIRLVLAGSVPRWRAPQRPDYDAAATSTAAREMWIELDARGGLLRQTHIAVGSERSDAFSPGQPHDSERCWCCDVRDAASDIGLCEPCHAALVSR